METQEIAKKLNEFIACQSFTDYTFPKEHKLKLSEGCKEILDQLKFEWLFDMILFFNMTNRQAIVPLQVWSFTRLKNGRVKMSCEDESGNHLFGYSGNNLDFYCDIKFIVNNNYIAIYDEVYDEPE